MPTQKQILLVLGTVFIILCLSVLLFLGGWQGQGHSLLDRDLIDACIEANPDKVTVLLRDGANPNAIDYRGEAAISHQNVVPGGITPLIAVSLADSMSAECDENEKNIFRILASRGATLGFRNNSGATALHCAVLANKPHLVELLLRFGADPNSVLIEDKHRASRRTPLHDASTSQAIFDLLLDHGADPTAANSKGDTPVDLANRHGRFRVKVTATSILTMSSDFDAVSGEGSGRVGIHRNQ